MSFVLHVSLLKLAKVCISHYLFVGISDCSYFVGIYILLLFTCSLCRSFREQMIMRKTYLFLLLMIIILPSVGLAR